MSNTEVQSNPHSKQAACACNTDTARLHGPLRPGGGSGKGAGSGTKGIGGGFIVGDVAIIIVVSGDLDSIIPFC